MTVDELIRIAARRQAAAKADSYRLELERLFAPPPSFHNPLSIISDGDRIVIMNKTKEFEESSFNKVVNSINDDLYRGFVEMADKVLEKL